MQHSAWPIASEVAGKQVVSCRQTCLDCRVFHPYLGVLTSGMSTLHEWGKLGYTGQWQTTNWMYPSMLHHSQGNFCSNRLVALAPGFLLHGLLAVICICSSRTPVQFCSNRHFTLTYGWAVVWYHWARVCGKLALAVHKNKPALKKKKSLSFFYYIICSAPRVYKAMAYICYPVILACSYIKYIGIDL